MKIEMFEKVKVKTGRKISTTKKKRRRKIAKTATTTTTNSKFSSRSSDNYYCYYWCELHEKKGTSNDVIESVDTSG